MGRGLGGGARCMIDGWMDWGVGGSGAKGGACKIWMDTWGLGGVGL